MKSDIKRKFLDILFEPEDEDDEVYEKPKQEVKPVKKQENTVKAADILYRKQEKSAFIDLNEKKKKPEKKQEENVYGDYEFSSQISPIFGVIKESKVETNTSVSVDEALINNFLRPSRLPTRKNCIVFWTRTMAMMNIPTMIWKMKTKRSISLIPTERKNNVLLYRY